MESETPQTSQQAQFDMYKWMAWLHANRKAVITVTVVAAIIGSAIGIYSWKKGQDESAANAKLFALPFTGEKGARVTAADLENVAKAYPNTSAGERAELLAAGTLFSDNNYKQAREAFSNFLSKYPGSQLAPQANIGVAASAEALGDTNAIQLYQQAIKKYPNDQIVDPAKLTIARLYEAQGKPEEALKYYDELTRNPDFRNPWVGEAHERKAVLLAKNPKLIKAAPAPSIVPATSAVPVIKPQGIPATNAPTKTK